MTYAVMQTGRNTLFADAGFGYLKERRTLGISLSTPTAGAGTRYKLSLKVSKRAALRR